MVREQPQLSFSRFSDYIYFTYASNSISIQTQLHIQYMFIIIRVLHSFHGATEINLAHRQWRTDGVMLIKLLMRMVLCVYSYHVIWFLWCPLLLGNRLGYLLLSAGLMAISTADPSITPGNKNRSLQIHERLSRN